MSSCWTCGSTVAGFSHTCPSCASLKGLADLKGQVQFQGLATNLGLAQLARVQAKGFEQLQATMAKGLAQVADVVEWGFNELGWRIQEQTDVIKDIDHTLKTPTQTRGNEYRTMADELTKRGEYGQADGLYRKSLNLNPLDFRTYVGLADTLLRSNRAAEAREVLHKSLPHAPRLEGKELPEPGTPVISDWKSYSLRLIGHIDACEGDYTLAASSLRSAVELSPFYAEGLYDYAQYTARIGEAPTSMTSLKQAIKLNSLYWYLPHRQRAFAPIKEDLKQLLTALRNSALEKTEYAIDKCQQAITAFGKVVTFYKLEYVSAAASHKLSSWEQERTLLDVMEKTVRDYTARLQSISDSRDTKDYSSLLTAPVDADNLREEARAYLATASNSLTALRKSVAYKRQRRLAVAIAILAFVLVFGYICYAINSSQRTEAARQRDEAASQEVVRLQAEEAAKNKMEVEGREVLRKKQEKARRDGFLNRFTEAARAKGWVITENKFENAIFNTALFNEEGGIRYYNAIAKRPDLNLTEVSITHNYNGRFYTTFKVCILDQVGPGYRATWEVSYENWQRLPEKENSRWGSSSPEVFATYDKWQVLFPELLNLLKNSW